MHPKHTTSSITVRATPRYVEALRDARTRYDAQLVERIQAKRAMEADLAASHDPVCKYYLRGAIETVSGAIQRLRHELGSVERTLQLARVS